MSLYRYHYFACFLKPNQKYLKNCFPLIINSMTFTLETDEYENYEGDGPVFELEDESDDESI